VDGGGAATTVDGDDGRCSDGVLHGQREVGVRRDTGKREGVARRKSSPNAVTWRWHNTGTTKLR
jgi:hypothetical protein